MDHYLTEAVEELRQKTKYWSEYYCGGLNYLLSYAAAGRLQFFALLRGSAVTAVTAVEISPVYDLTNPDGRAAVVLATINLYTLLAAVRRSLPPYLLPAGKELSRDDPNGFKRTLYAPPYTQCQLVFSYDIESAS